MDLVHAELWVVEHDELALLDGEAGVHVPDLLQVWVVDDEQGPARAAETKRQSKRYTIRCQRSPGASFRRGFSCKCRLPFSYLGSYFGSS